MPQKSRPERHARLFELLRQQNRAKRIARRIATNPAPNDAMLADVARRAVASWQKIR